MKTLTTNQSRQISGGYAQITSEGITVTNISRVSMQGIVYTPSGCLYSQSTGALYHNFTVDPSPANVSGQSISAKPIAGGYFYYFN